MPIAYIVPGYGVARTPKQLEEVNYYLTIVRSFIASQTKDTALVVFTGGATASTPPYGDTEAACLKTHWLAQDASTAIKFLIEPTAICSLENILLARQLLEPQFSSGLMRIFVENIRMHRMQIICEHLLKGYTTEVIPIDLGHQHDVAAQEGERIGIIWIKWALANPQNLAWYRSVFAEKIAAAQQATHQGQVFDAVTWWQTKWALIKERLATDGYLV